MKIFGFGEEDVLRTNKASVKMQLSAVCARRAKPDTAFWAHRNCHWHTQSRQNRCDLLLHSATWQPQKRAGTEVTEESAEETIGARKEWPGREGVGAA